MCPKSGRAQACPRVGIGPQRGSPCGGWWGESGWSVVVGLLLLAQMLLPKTGQEPLSVTSSQDHLGGRKGRLWGLGWWERCPLVLLQGSLGVSEQEARA